MVTVEFLGPIGKAPIEVEASTLNDISEHLQGDAEVSDWLKSCAIAVNDTMVNSLEYSLKSGDKISLLPPVCGG